MFESVNTFVIVRLKFFSRAHPGHEKARTWRAQLAVRPKGLAMNQPVQQIMALLQQREAARKMRAEAQAGLDQLGVVTKRHRKGISWVYKSSVADPSAAFK